MIHAIDKRSATGIAGCLMLVLAVGMLLAQAAPESHAQVKAQASKPIASKGAKSHDAADAGDAVFARHCSRCHNAPEGFSSRISGTIVTHMRVRAALSQREAENLARFFNP